MTNANKYRNIAVETPAGRFDSRKEYKYWLYLLTLLKRGEIADLKRQVRYELIPPQYEEVSVQLKTKTKVVKKLAEKACCYIADFTYIDSQGNLVVVDVKSPATRKNAEYRIKRKLMLFIHHIKIQEV